MRIRLRGFVVELLWLPETYHYQAGILQADEIALKQPDAFLLDHRFSMAQCLSTLREMNLSECRKVHCHSGYLTYLASLSRSGNTINTKPWGSLISFS